VVERAGADLTGATKRGSACNQLIGRTFVWMRFN